MKIFSLVAPEPLFERRLIELGLHLIENKNGELDAPRLREALRKRLKAAFRETTDSIGTGTEADRTNEARFAGYHRGTHTLAYRLWGNLARNNCDETSAEEIKGTFRNKALCAILGDEEAKKWLAQFQNEHNS